MNMPTHLHNARFALCLIGLLLSACTPTMIPQQQRDPRGITSHSAPYEQPVYPSTTATQSLQGAQILSSYSGSYALLIGESRYTEGWPNLESIPGELDKVEEVLIKQGFTVEKSLNLNADKLSNRFKTFINHYGFDENNRLLFFYSGHGHTRKNKGYLVSTDAPNPDFDEKGFLQKTVTMSEILAMARKMEAKHALFLFDSCFSGTVFKAKNLQKIPRQISQAAKLPVRQFITAGSANETVPAKSVFAPAFVDALHYGWGDMNKDGYVTGQELGLYLWNKVPQHTDQTPQYGKIHDYELSRGDFVFVVGGKRQVAETQSMPSPPPVATTPVAPKPTRPSSSSYRYTDNGDGSVTDNRSGLIWLKNANCFGKQNWETAMQSATNLADGQCGLGDGSRAGMWRLPTKEEWKAMIDEKYGIAWKRPALSNAAGTGPWKEDDAFSGVQLYYWSSTPFANDSNFAWFVYFDDGFVYHDTKYKPNYVWPLRGGV
ncbi:MAG: DUF1566 domain-containing protein [Candidatus Parabeggiatoa sp.]|nr:DUF1566 domain-containing protein [Candidatus Parabeggiatoa sp.]